MTPEQRLTEEAGGVTGTSAKVWRWILQSSESLSSVSPHGAMPGEKARKLTSSDPLQRMREEREELIQSKKMMLGSKEFMDDPNASEMVEDRQAQIERLDRMIALMEEQNKAQPQPVTVNNNITIAPNANVEARVTQEAQPTQSKAQNGSAPTVPKSAGVR